jgi:excisionase family DNA binding protein
MLITISRAAKECGLSLSTAREKVRKGEWPTYRFGAKSTRVDLQEIKKIARKRGQKINGERAA